MAVIPQIVTSPGAVPSTGGSGPRVSPQVDIRAPSDPSGALQAAATLESSAYQTTIRAADKLADYGQQFADQYAKAKLNVAAADWQADLSKKLHEAEFESSKISDRQAATADFDGRVSKIKDDFAAQDVNTIVRSAVDASLPNQIALRRASTQNASFGLESKQQVGKLIEQINLYNKQALDAADPRLTELAIQQANAAIDGRVAGGWLGADVAAKMKVDFGSSVYRTKIELAMSKDMQTGIALYNATASKLNAADARAMGIMAADRTKQVEAEASVSTNMPRMGEGGDIGAVRADAEKSLGFPVTVTSADRSEAHNKAVGGATGSQHLQHGKAIDISLAGMSDEQKQKVYQHFLNDPRVGGIGFYAGHLHVDTRGGPRQTWGTQPSAMREQIQAWQGSPAATPSGDQHAQTRIEQFRYRQSIIDNLSLDPEAKARQLSIIDRNMGNTNAIVMEQRKSAADAAEKAGIDLSTGKYKPGTFQGIADQFTATGDSSSAATFQVLADRESQLIEDAKNPPEQRSAASMLLPGAGGRIAAQQSAEKKADIVEQRRLGAQHRADNLKAAAEQEKIFSEGVAAGGDPRTFKKNMDDAIDYAINAGDFRKARELHEQYVGTAQGAKENKLPPAEREKAKRELEEKIQNQKDIGLPVTRAQAEALKFHGKNEEANRQKWEQDPLSATHDIGRIQLQGFDINMDPTNLSMWATQRTKDLTVATYSMDGSATNLRANFFTTAEMSTITQKLDGMPPREAQQFLAKLAKAVPAQVISLIGQQMSKKDPVSDAYAGALGLYNRGQPGDIEIANSVIVGMNWQSKGGTDGKTRIGDDKIAQSTIDDALRAARVNMNPDAVRLQNNVIMAHYVGLTANKPDRTSIDTAMLTKAITDIVGRPMTHNGAATLIPREIEPYQFRNGVAAITASDVPAVKGIVNAPLAVSRVPFEQAKTALNLSSQEQALYERHLTNLGGPGGVDNADKSRSTLYAMTTSIEGRSYILPTVYDGKILKPDEAVARARKEGLESFPSYATDAQAEARYQQLHSFMERDTEQFMRDRPSAEKLAATVRQHGQFVPSGDGKYQVRIPDPLQSGRTVQLIDANTGKPWEVDIKPLIARGLGENRAGVEGRNQPGMPRSTRGIPVLVPTEPTP